MASFLTTDFDDKAGSHLPPVNRKSKMPVKVTRLSSDSNRSSSEDEEELGKRNHRSPRDTVNKLRKNRKSNIPVLVAQKKSGKLTKLSGHVSKEEKPLEKDSGRRQTVIFFKIRKNLQAFKGNQCNPVMLASLKRLREVAEAWSCGIC